MKYRLIIILLFGLSVNSFSQSKELSVFKNSIFRLFPRSEPKFDSCYSVYTMLIVEIRNNFSVEKLSLSDSEPKWMKDDLVTIKPKLNLTALSGYAKSIKFTGKLIFPVIAQSSHDSCKYDDLLLTDSDAVYSQNNQKISGKIKFDETLVFLNINYKTKK